MNPETQDPGTTSDQQEDEVPARGWERTILALTPFALLGLLFLLDRLIRG